MTAFLIPSQNDSVKILTSVLKYSSTAWQTYGVSDVHDVLSTTDRYIPVTMPRLVASAIQTISSIQKSTVTSIVLILIRGGECVYVEGAVGT